MHRHEFTDKQWDATEPLLPKRTANTGREPKDLRLMLNGVVWVLCMGVPWRDLPSRFGPWQTVYDYFLNWRNGSTFSTVLDALQVHFDKAGLIDWDLW